MSHREGFTLPTVLLSSIIMISVLLAGLQLAIASSNALKAQYYNQLAREAAESGLVYAQACLAENNDVAQWTTKALTPSTDCAGAPRGGLLNMWSAPMA